MISTMNVETDKRKRKSRYFVDYFWKIFSCYL